MTWGCTQKSGRFCFISVSLFAYFSVRLYTLSFALFTLYPSTFLGHGQVAFWYGADGGIDLLVHFGIGRSCVACQGVWGCYEGGNTTVRRYGWFNRGLAGGSDLIQLDVC